VQLILRKIALDISLAVAQVRNVSMIQARQSHRAMGQPIGQGLRLRALNLLRVVCLIEPLA
jgi:hypothetical protein